MTRLIFIKKLFNGKGILELGEFFYMNISAYMNSKKYSLLEKSISLKGKYQNERLFMFFTGSSINKIKLDLFKYEYSMVTNLFVFHHQFFPYNFLHESFHKKNEGQPECE